MFYNVCLFLYSVSEYLIDFCSFTLIMYTCWGLLKKSAHYSKYVAQSIRVHVTNEMRRHDPYDTYDEYNVFSVRVCVRVCTLNPPFTMATSPERCPVEGGDRIRESRIREG